MPLSIEVEVDESGHMHPLQPTSSLPKGRATLRWNTLSDDNFLLVSESALAEDWRSPEEDEAWAYLQRDR